MKLYVVRLIESKEPVGLFWARDASTDLFWAIDEVTDPGACEYAVINRPAAILWMGSVSWQIGANDAEQGIDDDAEQDIDHLAGASFSEALEAKLLFDDGLKWKKPVGCEVAYEALRRDAVSQAQQKAAE